MVADTNFWLTILKVLPPRQFSNICISTPGLLILLFRKQYRIQNQLMTKITDIAFWLFHYLFNALLFVTHPVIKSKCFLKQKFMLGTSHHKQWLVNKTSRLFFCFKTNKQKKKVKCFIWVKQAQSYRSYPEFAYIFFLKIQKAFFFNRYGKKVLPGFQPVKRDCNISLLVDIVFTAICHFFMLLVSETHHSYPVLNPFSLLPQMFLSNSQIRIRW